MNKIFIAKLIRGDCIINSIRIEAANIDKAWDELRSYLKDKQNLYDDYYILPEN